MKAQARGFRVDYTARMFAAGRRAAVHNAMQMDSKAVALAALLGESKKAPERTRTERLAALLG